MSTVTLPGGETVWYKRTGSGEPVLHIHGSAFGHRNFEKLTPLTALDFEVIDFDLPGFGQSRGAPRENGLQGIAEQVFEFIGALGLTRLHVHGTSFGAMVALNLAAQHPQVIDRLVLSCFLARYDKAARMMRSTWRRTARDSGMEAVADLTAVAGFSRGYYERPEAEAQLASMREAFSHTEPEAFIASTEAIEKTDLTPLAAKVTAPTLLIAGEEDNMTPFNPPPSGSGFAQIKDDFHDSEVVVLSECGHYLVLEQPQKAADLVKEFLQRPVPA
jgi:pimeloyl-ACP methyl ester carboxylesterase